MVADGYKETDIGVIPVEWDVVEQKEVATFYNGRAYKLSEWEKEGTPVIRLQNLTGSGKDFYYSKMELPKHQYCSSGDLLYMWSATFGPVWWHGDKAIYHYHIWKIITDDKKLNKTFLYFLLDEITIRMKNQSHGSTMMHVTKGGMEKLKIQLPPLKEQEKIADILSTADDKIDAIASQIENAEKLKKGLLQKLLNEGIGHSEFKDSELGKIPESWKVVELGKCVDGKGKYGIGAASVNYDKNLPTYLRITDIDENGKFISTNKKCVDSPEAFNYKLEDGDIVFARTGNTTGKTYHYNSDDGVLIYAGFLIKFTPNKELLDTYYLKLQTETSRYWNWVKVTSMRTGQPGINSEEYGKFLLPLPPLEEQKQIADILSTADEKLEVLRAKKEKYETLKKGLLQKLLSGEVRV